MKIPKRMTAALTALLIMLNVLPVSALEPQIPSGKAMTLDKTAALELNISSTGDDPPKTTDTDSNIDSSTDAIGNGSNINDNSPDKTSGTDNAENSSNTDNSNADNNDADNNDTDNNDADNSNADNNDADNNDKTDNAKDHTENEQLPDFEKKEEEPDSPDSDGVPAFHPELKASFQNYLIEAVLADPKLDKSLIKPLYSKDGETYQECGEAWDILPFGVQYKFCLYSNCEPLKGYLAHNIDRFYLKLRITRENGTTYETQPALTDRGILQPMPENVSLSAMFSPAMAVIHTRPFDYYGGYQLTVRENATAEEILTYLPDTLPVKVNLQIGKNYFADSTIDCPVTWKPLSLPQLTAGESITIADAADKIVVPAGTQITTPMGIYQLTEPLPLDEPIGNSPYPFTDEVRLVLNVIAENENPTGVLSEEHTGLEMSFQFKPTGATVLRVYTLSEGDSEWMEVSNHSLSEAVNAYPSARNSGYTLAIPNTCEPYRSYLEAKSAGDSPRPFLVGLKIEGGVYNGKQLILPWPDTYELPLKLPEIGGSGGNHNNAGAASKDDSTESGQRPNLPQTPENKPQIPAAPDAGDNNTESGGKNDSTANGKHPDISPEPAHTPETSASPDTGEKNTVPDNKNDQTEDSLSPTTSPYSENKPQATVPPENAKNDQRQDFPQHPAAKPKTPMKLNMPDKPSDYQILLNRRSENISWNNTPFLQFPTIIQVQADIAAKNCTRDSTSNTKNSFPEKLTPSIPLRQKVITPNTSVSSNKEITKDSWKSPRRNMDSRYHKPLLSAAVIAASVLCIAVIYFAAVPGQITGISRRLRKYFLKK